MGPGEKGVGRDPIKVGVIKKKIKKIYRGEEERARKRLE